MPSSDKKGLAGIVAALERQIRELERRDLHFAASMLKIARLDLQISLHDISPEELDLLGRRLDDFTHNDEVADTAQPAKEHYG
jgi:hypothetical protein